MSSSQETHIASNDSHRPEENAQTHQSINTVPSPTDTSDVNNNLVNDASQNANDRKNLTLTGTNSSYYVTSRTSTFVGTSNLVNIIDTGTMPSLTNDGIGTTLKKNDTGAMTTTIFTYDIGTSQNKNDTGTMKTPIDNINTDTLSSQADTNTGTSTSLIDNINTDTLSSQTKNNTRTITSLTNNSNFGTSTSLNNNNIETLLNNNTDETLVSSSNNDSGFSSLSNNNRVRETLKLPNNNVNSSFTHDSLDTMLDTDPDLTENNVQIGNLCNFQLFIESIGVAVKHVTGIISKHYSKFVNEIKESGCLSDADVGGPSENRSDLFNDSPPRDSILSMDFNQTMRALELFEKLGTNGNEKSSKYVEERLSDLEDGNMRHSILLNDSYKFYLLLARRIRSLQDGFKMVSNELLKIKSVQDVIQSDQEVVKNYLREIKNNQEEIKMNQENQKFNDKNQESSVKAQKILTTSVNEMSADNDDSETLEGASSRPSLNFYNFNCAIPNTIQLYDINSNLSLFRILNSKESFKSTLDYFYAYEFEGNTESSSNESCNDKTESECNEFSEKMNVSNENLTVTEEINNSIITNKTDKENCMKEISNDFEGNNVTVEANDIDSFDDKKLDSSLTEPERSK